MPVVRSAVLAGAACAVMLASLSSSSLAQSCGFVGKCGDLDQNGSVTVTDALSLLRTSVGQNVGIECECAGESSPVCEAELAECNDDLALCEARPVCGDGLVEEGEDCDAGVELTETCESLEFQGGTLECAYCVFDTSDCYETRFVPNGATVLDLQTGLEWESKEDLDSVQDYENPHDADNDYTWCAGAGINCNEDSDPLDGTIATDFLANLNGTSGACFEGHCDWRLPTLQELQAISLDQDTCESAPCVANPALLPMRSNYYWTSATYLFDSAIAWLVNFADGSSTASYKATKSYVRAVRAVTD